MVKKSYSTGEVAKSIDPPVHNDTVLRYERQGLLGVVRKNERGQRRFTHEQKVKFKQIFEAKNR